MPLGVVFGIILSNILVKGVTTVVSLPLIYTVPERRVELGVEEP
jgi:hypothetical protein